MATKKLDTVKLDTVFDLTITLATDNESLCDWDDGSTLILEWHYHFQ